MGFSSLLGMFDGIIESISSFFTDLFNSVLWSGILKFLGILLYSFSIALFSVMDFLASFFRRIVGLDGGVSMGGKQVTGDIVLSLIQSREVMNVFIALLVVAVFLLFVSTIVAIIKSEYNFDKGGNAKGPIFGRAIKALFYFLSVPTVCIFGVWMANQLLSVLDEATGGGGQNSHLSSLVFAACCNNANRIGNDGEFWSAYRQSDSVSGAGGGRAFFIDSVSLSGNDIPNDADARQTIANGVNDAFKKETPFKQVYGSGNNTYDNIFEWSPSGRMGKPEGVTGSQEGFKWHYGLSLNNIYDGSNGTFSVYDINLVWFYYNIFSYDHLISLLACFLILKALFDLCMGVTKRIYEMIVLFCVSPPIVALMPLDEGAAYKNWTKAFVGKTLAAYGGVLAINFFYMLVPVLQTINVFDNVSFGIINMTGVFNYFAQLIMIIAGAVSLSSISGMISGLIGAEDAVKSGSEISGAVAGTVARMGGMAVGLGKAAIAKGVGVAKGIKNRNAEKREITGKPSEDVNGIAETTGNIANAVDANQAVGNNAGDGSNPPSGGGDGGGSGGGSTPPAGGRSPNADKAVGGGASGGQSNGITSDSSGPSAYDKKVAKAYDKTFGGAMKNFAYAAKTGNVAGMASSGLRAGFQAGKGVLKAGGKLLKGLAGMTLSHMLGDDYKKVSKAFSETSENESFDKMMDERRKNKSKFKADVKAYGHERWRAGVKANYEHKVDIAARKATRDKNVQHAKYEVKTAKNSLKDTKNKIKASNAKREELIEKYGERDGAMEFSLQDKGQLAALKNQVKNDKKEIKKAKKNVKVTRKNW